MKRLCSVLKYICIVALVISLLSLAAVVAYALINGVGKLSFNLEFGEYLPDTPTMLPAII